MSAPYGEEGAWPDLLAARYASRAMAALFSPRRRYVTWRRLWVALAEAERACGLPIRAEQIEGLRRRLEDVPFERVAALEAELRHDVMAHLHAYAEQVPEARPILHLGATSCYVTDNADLILMREGLEILRGRLLAVLAALAGFARAHADTACLAYTHLQPAQPTTMGRRACLWIQDLLWDFRELERLREELPFLGAKGTTGTQESFLKLFEGDEERVEELDRRVAAAFGFRRLLRVTGQTYPRKLDVRVAGVLAGIAQSAGKFAGDVRLLQGLGEVSEPFGAKQVGSSAMPYKRNPVRAERISSLSRYVLVTAQNAALTAATQWLERSLDDSANRRRVLPDLFLAADAVLLLYREVAAGLTVHTEVVARRLREELPFLATEEILVRAVKAGGDRQKLHEAIRRHAMDVRRRMAAEGAPNDLLARLAADPAFAPVRALLPTFAEARRFTGRARTQALRFLAEEVEPLLSREREALRAEETTRV